MAFWRVWRGWERDEGSWIAEYSGTTICIYLATDEKLASEEEERRGERKRERAEKRQEAGAIGR